MSAQRPKKPPPPLPYRCARGPQQPRQPLSDIEIAWSDWRAALYAEDLALVSATEAEMVNAMAAVKANVAHKEAMKRTRAAKRRLHQLAHQAIGAIPHERIPPLDP